MVVTAIIPSSPLAKFVFNAFIKGSVSFSMQYTVEACIGVIGIQDICHFTSRDIGYYPFYFQGYRILCSISGILYFLLKNKKTTEKTTVKVHFERRELKMKTF